mmetsp:Transcript_5615/g.5772  ORF Transcript_5615/g.5772 Transcript_5615/m.5772 type:complete len:215 (-) Transcript_5615:237-881(-)
MNLIDRDFLLSPKRKRLSQGQSQSGFSKNQTNQMKLDKVFLPPFDCENEPYNSDYRMLDEDGGSPMQDSPLKARRYSRPPSSSSNQHKTLTRCEKDMGGMDDILRQDSNASPSSSCSQINTTIESNRNSILFSPESSSSSHSHSHSHGYEGGGAVTGTKAPLTGMKVPQRPNGSLQVSMNPMKRDMNLMRGGMIGGGKPCRNQILKKKCMQTLD